MPPRVETAKEKEDRLKREEYIPDIETLPSSWTQEQKIYFSTMKLGDLTRSPTEVLLEDIECAYQVKEGMSMPKLVHIAYTTLEIGKIKLAIELNILNLNIHIDNLEMNDHVDVFEPDLEDYFVRSERGPG